MQNEYKSAYRDVLEQVEVNKALDNLQIPKKDTRVKRDQKSSEKETLKHLWLIIHTKIFQGIERFL